MCNCNLFIISLKILEARVSNSTKKELPPYENELLLKQIAKNHISLVFINNFIKNKEIEGWQYKKWVVNICDIKHRENNTAPIYYLVIYIGKRRLFLSQEFE